MAYSIRPHRAFERPFSRLPNELKRRVVEKLEFLAAHPEIIGPPMRHLPADLRGLHKVRVGDWRIFFWAEHTNREIVPYDVNRRDTAYRKLRKT